MDKTLWADRGQLLQPAPGGSTGAATVASANCIGVSRLGSAQMPAEAFTCWVQLRGSSWVEAREGRFQLRRGDWMAFERDSRPQLQADRHGLCIGISLAPDAFKAAGKLLEAGLHAGRGTIGQADARMLLRVWRAARQRLAAGKDPSEAGDIAALRPLLLQLGAMQGDLVARIPRCPGRSRLRQRQVFGRLQRAHMYLQGNCDRVVRISELAELTSFSSWYFSKTFHALYDESPQAASARMRIERAAALLRDSQMMIGEVAAASGFDNCCSFARAFRARYGTSASNYRTAVRGKAGAVPMVPAEARGSSRPAVREAA